MTTGPLSMKDLAGFSEPATEVVKSISKAIGAIYEPTRIIKKAQAEAKAKEIHAKADAEVEFIRWQAQTRINHHEERRQININQIVDSAAKQLPGKIGEDRPDEDWLIQFFNYSQDIGNEEMQDLWSKILAGEFIHPGSFSIKNIEFSKMINQRDALLFKQVSNFVWDTSSIIYSSELYPFFTSRGIKYIDFIHLETLDLLTLGKTSWKVDPGKSVIVTYLNDQYVFRNQSAIEMNSISTIKLTVIGEELHSLCNPVPDTEYIDHVAKYYSTRKYYPFDIYRVIK